MKKRADFKSGILIIVLVMIISHTFIHLAYYNKENAKGASVSGLSISEGNVGENVPTLRTKAASYTEVHYHNDIQMV